MKQNPMKPKKLQLDFVRDHIKRYGSITRNYALKNYITRLSEYIRRLRDDEGMMIAGGYVKTKNGKDYRYTLLTFKKKRYGR